MLNIFAQVMFDATRNTAMDKDWRSTLSNAHRNKTPKTWVKKTRKIQAPIKTEAKTNDSR